MLVFFVRPDPKEIAAHLDRYYPGYRLRARRSAGALARVGVREYLREYPKQVAFVTSFALFGNMSMMMAMNAVALAHHGHGLSAISFSVALHIVGMFGFSLPLGRLADAVGRRKVMLLGLGLAGVGGSLVPTSPDYWVVTAGTFLVGLGWSCGNVAIVALLADTTPPLARGRAIGLNDTCSGAASISLPVLAGPLVEVVGLPALAVVSAALMIVPLILLLRLREPSPGRYDHPTPGPAPDAAHAPARRAPLTPGTVAEWPAARGARIGGIRTPEAGGGRRDDHQPAVRGVRCRAALGHAAGLSCSDGRASAYSICSARRWPVLARPPRR